MKTSEILRASKKYLWQGNNHPKFGKDEHICYAIISAFGRMQEAGQQHYTEYPRHLLNEIHARLHPYSSVTEWLSHNVPEFKEHECSGTVIQTYRHRWVDHLIAEYEAQGD